MKLLGSGCTASISWRDAAGSAATRRNYRADIGRFADWMAAGVLRGIVARCPLVGDELRHADTPARQPAPLGAVGLAAHLAACSLRPVRAEDRWASGFAGGSKGSPLASPGLGPTPGRLPTPCRSPWMNPDEHREARSAGLARRDEARGGPARMQRGSNLPWPRAATPRGRNAALDQDHFKP